MKLLDIIIAFFKGSHAKRSQNILRTITDMQGQLVKVNQDIEKENQKELAKIQRLRAKLSENETLQKKNAVTINRFNILLGSEE